MKAKLVFQARKCVPTGTPCLHPLPNSSEATTEKQRYKRFCSVCRKVTYEWFCCGKRTRRLNLESTIADRMKVKTVNE